MNVPANFVHRDGETLSRLLRFVPLKDAAGNVDSILGVVTLLERPSRAAHASSAQQLHAELAALRISLRQRFGIRNFVGRDRSMIRVFEQIRLARQSDVSVFLHGEQGTGKEHVARLIHYEGETRARSFVPLDCRRLPATQLKETLQRLLHRDPEAASAIPAFQPGTLYLAEVDQLPRDLQGEIAESFAAAPPDGRPALRLMSSSSVDLQQAVDEDRLLADLYYRLTSLTIELPPLRGRADDLQPLAQHFLERLNLGSDRQVSGVDEQIWEQFREYNWPGNLDELAAVVEEARAACSGSLVRANDLPFRFRTGLDAQSVGPVLAPKPVPLEPLLAKVETEQIELALQQSRHNKSKAAELLGITRARLYRRMEQLGISDVEGGASD
jgi:DNA-binding NtrC family response regulator